MRGWGGAQSQEFTAFACAVEGFDLGEDGLAYELILGRHHLSVQRALQALLRLNAWPANISNYHRISVRVFTSVPDTVRDILNDTDPVPDPWIRTLDYGSGSFRR
jgi:hypothetical protein